MGLGSTNESCCPFLLPQSDLSFGLRCSQGQGVNRARHAPSYIMNFPPLASSLPPFLVPRFRPSRNHISRPRALPHSSHLSTIIPLYSSGAWHYLGVLASPFIRLEIRRSFRFPAPAHTVYACALPAATFDPPTRPSHIPSASNTPAWMCTTTQQAILMVHKLTAVATSKARLLRQVCPVP
jgi:hypothetical protein